MKINKISLIFLKVATMTTIAFFTSENALALLCAAGTQRTICEWSPGNFAADGFHAYDTTSTSSFQAHCNYAKKIDPPNDPLWYEYTCQLGDTDGGLRDNCFNNFYPDPSGVLCDEDHDGFTYTKFYRNGIDTDSYSWQTGPTYTCNYNGQPTCNSPQTWDAEVNDCVDPPQAGNGNGFAGIVGDISSQAGTASLVTQALTNAAKNYSGSTGINPNAAQMASTDAGVTSKSLASKGTGTDLTNKDSATASGKKSTGSGGLGGAAGGGGLMSALGNLFGSSDLKPETDAGQTSNSVNSLAATEGDNGSAYSVGGKGSAGKKSASPSYASVLAGNGAGIEFGRDPASSNVNPMGCDDPANYFARIGLEESIFKRVETRYRETTTQWARVELSKDRLPASKKALDAAKDPTELMKSSIK